MVDEEEVLEEPVEDQEAESAIDDYQSNDLDIDSLIKKFVQPIDKFRSYNAPIISGPLRQPELCENTIYQESRVHTFYRMLGLPTISPNGKFYNPGFIPRSLIDAREDRRRADVLASIPLAVKQFVQEREASARRRFNLFSRANAYSTLFTIAMAVPNGQRPLNMAGENDLTSLTQPAEQSFPIPERKQFIQKRYKNNDGSDINIFYDTVFHALAPFMVDPVIAANISPNSGDKAVWVGAPFLEKKNLEYQRGMYAKRPGLEFILRLRLRQQNVAEQFNLSIANVKLESIKGDISVERQRDIAAALSDVGVSEVDIDETLNGSGRVELYTLNDLVKSYKGLIHLWVENVEAIERIYRRIVWVPLSQEGGPERGTDVYTGFIIPKEQLDCWELSHKISQLESKSSLASKHLEINDTGDETMKYSDFAISEFQNLKDLFTSQLQEAQNERDQLEAEASNALRIIEFISGEVSGFGLLDILAIYMALWSLDVSVLLDLIDDPAAQRLNQISELRSGATTARARKQGNAKEAYKKFANRVQTILSYGDKLYQSELGSPVEKEGGDIVRDPGYNEQLGY